MIDGASRYGKRIAWGRALLGIDPVTGVPVPGGIGAEAGQALKNLHELPAAAGSDFFKVVRATVFLADIDHVATGNAIYAKLWEPGTMPKLIRTAVRGDLEVSA